MAQAAVSELDKRVPGRRWTVRLNAASRGSAAVRISCSRPACAEQRLPSAAAGRAAAIAHLKAHLRAAPVPRPGAYCACRADGCRTHLPETGRPTRAEPWRCGGPVVLAVVTDRGGRWWQALECCSRCAAATHGAKTVATSQEPESHLSEHRSPAAPSATPFSHRQAEAVTGLPASRSAPARRRPPQSKIAQRVIPHHLRPVALRDELIELGDLFRAYQQRTEPDVALLANLHEREARAFTTWANVSGIESLRLETRCAEQAATAARFQHQQRTGGIADSDGPVVSRPLSGPTQGDHARAVLAHVADHTPLPGPEARLLVLMLTLRTANIGTGNLVGQDLTALGLTDPEDLLEKLTGRG